MTCGSIDGSRFVSGRIRTCLGPRLLSSSSFCMVLDLGSRTLCPIVRPFGYVRRKVFTISVTVSDRMDVYNNGKSIWSDIRSPVLLNCEGPLMPKTGPRRSAAAASPFSYFLQGAFFIDPRDIVRRVPIMRTNVHPFYVAAAVGRRQMR